MDIERKDVINKFENRYQLCFFCKNACGGCSWSRNFTPVEGWTAKMVIRKGIIHERYCKTYDIISCPEFVYDGMCTKCLNCPEEEKRNPLYGNQCKYARFTNGDICGNFRHSLSKMQKSRRRSILTSPSASKRRI